MRFRLFSALFWTALLWAAPVFSQNVVWITIDGVRRQEWFGGLDPVMLEHAEETGIENVDALRDAFWRDTPGERREALMPFFWTELAPQGVVMRSSIDNPHRSSYPGYAEILTGRVLLGITGNIDVQIPRETALEAVRRSLGLDETGVAAFTSWKHFSYIVESKPGTLFVNAGYEDVPPSFATSEMKRWNGLQLEMRTPWDSVRFNAVTLGLALEYLKTYRPRLLFIALDETDEWAHAGRYDRTVQALHNFDLGLRRLWAAIREIDGYRDHTTLVITTDHGRGRTPGDWTSHGKDVDGSRETWVAVIGPRTPDRGVVDEPVRNAQVAGTVLTLLGLDPAELGPGAGEPIRAAIE